MKWKTLVPLVALLGFKWIISLMAGEVPYEQLKGDALKEVLKPIPPKDPAEALGCLEGIDGFSVAFVAPEPLVLDRDAAVLDEDGQMSGAKAPDYPNRPHEHRTQNARV